MYQYTEFDKQFVRQRAAQFRDQLERNMARQTGRRRVPPLRLQNGWYVPAPRPMLRVAVPYGEISSKQIRQLADCPHTIVVTPTSPRAKTFQFQLDPAAKSADVMDLLAEVNMHGIQTSGNCIHNITADAMVGVAEDEIIDARPIEVLRQWSTLHPEFAFLPRKFKIAVSGAKEDRAAICWHDIGLQLVKDDEGEIGFQGHRRRWHGPHAHHRHRDQQFRALAANSGLHQGHRARLQPIWPSRQHVQGPDQDLGQS